MRFMEKTLGKKFRGVKVLMLLALAFAIGFECGRLSRRQEIKELEATAKSVGWWNMQLEDELQGLRGDEK